MKTEMENMEYKSVCKQHTSSWKFNYTQPESLQMMAVAMKLKDAYSSEGKLWQTQKCIKKQGHHFADKGPYIQNYGFSTSYVQMWELDHKEGWALKNWCFQTVLLEKTLESPLDSKEIKPVNPKGNQHWIVTGRTDAEAPILWPPDVKSWLIGKRSWCWERSKAKGKRGSRGWNG